jgi:threonine aldolase
MQPIQERHEFASDNTSGICPEAWAALQAANAGEVASYGDDSFTARLRKGICELFEIDCAVYPTFTGTAANALALAQLCRPFESVVCTAGAHIQTDECAAPEFFSGGAKLLGVGSVEGKIDLAAARTVLALQPELHAPRPRVISVTQASEFGTVYTLEELTAVAEFARTHKMYLHMDGARFANAVTHLNCAPNAITWKVGVDILCLGGTKNGLPAGELVVIFRKEIAREMDYRVKQGGQLPSKMRFLAAPWLGLLGNDVWRRNASHANSAARNLGALLEHCGLSPVFPVEANAVFIRFAPDLAEALRERGWRFYKFLEPDIYRLMCSWATSALMIREFIDDVKAIDTRAR